LPRKGNTWIWDPRPGTYYLEWWEGPQRRRVSAGTTPAEVLNAVRQKQHELAGQAVLGDLDSDANAVPETYAANLRGAAFAQAPARGEPRPLAAAPSCAGQRMLIGAPPAPEDSRRLVEQSLEHFNTSVPALRPRISGPGPYGGWTAAADVRWR
jgi:hypothetical protein